MFNKSLIFLAVLGLLQISAASPAVSEEHELHKVQSKSLLGDFLQNIVEGIEDAVRDIADLINNVLKNLSAALQTILKTVARSVHSVMAGTWKIIGTAIRAQADLLRKFRDALLRPALTNAKLSLEKLQNAIGKAIEAATQQFNEAVLQIELQSQQILNSVQKKVRENADQAKEVITALVNGNDQNELVQQCLLEQLEAVKDLDKNTVTGTNECISKHVEGANEIANDLASVLEHAFDGADVLVAELDACTAGLPNRPSFSQRREASTCLNTVSLKIRLAASQVSTDIAVKVGEVLRPLSDLRADLQQCADKNLLDLQTGLDEINDNVQYCL